MNYTEGIIRNTEFFTTTELAEKLKMNVQVITRKVQAGEIRAYKIGKEWRIPEPSVFEWLESNANSVESKGSNISRHRAKKPADHTSQRGHLLEYVLAQFEPNRLYREDEVNRIVERQHKDTPAIRKELLARHMMELADGQWRRCNGYRLSD
ncbi:MAG: helix-turn-helix domain-containing protein [candidate division Zixibacteria bacterium]|nr:helix-turn-helix domain-containing protein [candidate division Zixibacteria bacterium]